MPNDRNGKQFNKIRGTESLAVRSGQHDVVKVGKVELDRLINGELLARYGGWQFALSYSVVPANTERNLPAFTLLLLNKAARDLVVFKAADFDEHLDVKGWTYNAQYGRYATRVSKGATVEPIFKAFLGSAIEQLDAAYGTLIEAAKAAAAAREQAIVEARAAAARFDISIKEASDPVWKALGIDQTVYKVVTNEDEAAAARFVVGHHDATGRGQCEVRSVTVMSEGDKVGFLITVVNV